MENLCVWSSDGGVILQLKLEVGFSFVVDDSFCLLGASREVNLT